MEQKKSEPVEQMTFDTKWASNEYEMLIPEPPKGKYYNNEAENDFERYYHMQVSKLEKDVVTNYVALLQNCGYNADVIENPDGKDDCTYYFEGCNQEGIKVVVKIKNTPGGEQTVNSVVVPK